MNKLHLPGAVIALCIILASCRSDINQFTEDISKQNGIDASLISTENAMPNEMLIKFREGTSEKVKSDLLTRIGATVKEKILTKMMARLGHKEGINLVVSSVSVSDALSQLKANKEIEYIEPNYICTYNAVSNDPYFTNGSLWGMSASNPFGSQAATAWANNNTGSSNIYIGVIDEGFMPTHEDLAANVGVNPGEIPGNRIDDDGNGYVDDVSGWNFEDDNNKFFANNQDYHGTHVAGTIGAAGGNGKGVAGVAWSVKMLSAKFIGKKTGTVANAIKAVDYFTNLKTRPVNPVNIIATNNSWTIGGFVSQALYDAVARANNAGILFIAGADNTGTDNDAVPKYPSSYDLPNIISVAAIASDGTLSAFSNYGLTTVDLGAPGVDIYSCSAKPGGTDYRLDSGTSMAAPHVTGAVVLYAATHPNATASTIKNAILNSTTPTASLTGKCVTGGRLNVSSF